MSSAQSMEVSHKYFKVSENKKETLWKKKKERKGLTVQLLTALLQKLKTDDETSLHITKVTFCPWFISVVKENCCMVCVCVCVYVCVCVCVCV